MKRQALFFDIDGTLFSEIDRQVPHSAVLALKKTRENGHLVFINTGRTYCQTKGIRKEIEYDGDFHCYAANPNFAQALNEIIGRLEHEGFEIKEQGKPWINFKY